MITTIKEFRRINERLDINVVAKDKADLKQLITNNMKEFGNKCNLNYIDTSNITDMSCLFENHKINGNKYKFNGDISEWGCI